MLATFQSRFICDTRGAGAGQLTVRVRGPKGAFRVEMQRETQKDRIILCRYDPTEPGDYRVEVRWAGVLVPGSPFPVKIVDTQDELLMLTQVRIYIIYTHNYLFLNFYIDKIMIKYCNFLSLFNVIKKKYTFRCN